MTLTLLVDLDDTLLSNDMTVFIPAYFNALSNFFSPTYDASILLNSLISASRLMIENQDPLLSLKECFEKPFYTRLGSDPASFEDHVLTFYEQEFPKLIAYTKPRPEAIKLIETAFDRGYQVVIATNPLFPRTATLHRLEWAGLPLHSYPFSIVTTWESFHFAKPNPAYFTEILGQLGWQENPVIMIGNDESNDIQPAREIGLATFHVNNKATGNNQPTAYERNDSGSLADIIPWIDQHTEDGLRSNFNQPFAIKSTLSSTPAVLDTLVKHIHPNLWKYSPSPDEWSVTEIFCHLRDVDAEINLPRLHAFLEQATPFIEGVDSDSWNAARNYNEQDGFQSLLDFGRHRKELLTLLNRLHPDDWLLPGRHSILGPTNLLEIVRIIAEHDRIHIRQIQQLIPLHTIQHSQY